MPDQTPQKRPACKKITFAQSTRRCPLSLDRFGGRDISPRQFQLSPSPAAADLHLPLQPTSPRPSSEAMDTSDPALVTVEVGLAKSTAGGAAVDLPTGHVGSAADASSSVVPRKRLGNIIVQGGAPAPGATVAAAKGPARPKARPPARPTAAGNLGDTEPAQPVQKRKRAPPAKKASASSTPATAAVPEVFDGMPARYVRSSWDF